MNLKTGNGRLGNLIIMIKNALHIGLFYKYNIILPKNQFINTTYIVINDEIKIDDKQLTGNNGFFGRDEILNIDTNLFNENKDMVVKMLKDIFLLNNAKPLGVNDLVIHIRSGDIFASKSPHPRYLMPPLSYYRNIIEQNSFDNIYLIAEDKLNPCINRLLELFPKIIFKFQPFENDVDMILGASNIVISYGTLVPQLLDLSNIKKNIYIPSYMYKYKPECFRFITENECTFHVTELEDYYKIMIPWKNSPEQIETMITYESIKVGKID